MTVFSGHRLELRVIWRDFQSPGGGGSRDSCASHLHTSNDRSMTNDAIAIDYFIGESTDCMRSTSFRQSTRHGRVYALLVSSVFYQAYTVR